MTETEDIGHGESDKLGEGKRELRQTIITKGERGTKGEIPRIYVYLRIYYFYMYVRLCMCVFVYVCV